MSKHGSQAGDTLVFLHFHNAPMCRGKPTSRKWDRTNLTPPKIKFASPQTSQFLTQWNYPKDTCLKHGWLKNGDSPFLWQKNVGHNNVCFFFFSQSCLRYFWATSFDKLPCYERKQILLLACVYAMGVLPISIELRKKRKKVFVAKISFFQQSLLKVREHGFIYICRNAITHKNGEFFFFSVSHLQIDICQQHYSIRNPGAS